MPRYKIQDILFVLCILDQSILRCMIYYPHYGYYIYIYIIIVDKLTSEFCVQLLHIYRKQMSMLQLFAYLEVLNNPLEFLITLIHFIGICPSPQ